LLLYKKTDDYHVSKIAFFVFFAFVGVISPTKFCFVNNMLQVITPATAKKKEIDKDEFRKRFIAWL